MRNPRVTLYNPRTDYESVAHISRPPLGLIAIADACVRAGLNEITVIDDDIRRSDEGWIDRICDTKPDIVGITTWLGGFPNLSALKEAIGPKTLLVAGGPLASVIPDFHREMGADFVVSGDGTWIFPWLAKGQYKESSPLVRSSIQFAAGYQFFPMEEYISRWPDGKRGFMVITNIGCTHSCPFCKSNYLRNGHKPSFADEVSTLRMHGVQDLYIADANFTGDTAHFCDVSQFLEIWGPQSYFCETRADCLDKEKVRLLKTSRCRRVFMGLESASNKIGLHMKGEKNATSVLRAKALLDEAGIETAVFVLFGLPGETERTIQETLEFLERHELRASPNVLFPIPGTPIWDLAMGKGLIPSLADYLERMNDYNRQNRAFVSVSGLCAASEKTIIDAVNWVWQHNSQLERSTQ